MALAQQALAQLDRRQSRFPCRCRLKPGGRIHVAWRAHGTPRRRWPRPRPSASWGESVDRPGGSGGARVAPGSRTASSGEMLRTSEQATQLSARLGGQLIPAAGMGHVGMRRGVATNGTTSRGQRTRRRRALTCCGGQSSACCWCVDTLSWRRCTRHTAITMLHWIASSAVRNGSRRHGLPQPAPCSRLAGRLPGTAVGAAGQPHCGGPVGAGVRVCGRQRAGLCAAAHAGAAAPGAESERPRRAVPWRSEHHTGTAASCGRGARMDALPDRGPGAPGAGLPGASEPDQRTDRAPTRPDPRRTGRLRPHLRGRGRADGGAPACRISARHCAGPTSRDAAGRLPQD